MLRLERPGKGGRELRAWDAADEQLIAAVLERWPEVGPVRPDMAIIDDGFGALTLGLASYTPVSLADSALCRVAVNRNAELNDCPPPEVQSWLAPPADRFDVIVLKIPRHLDYLEYLLRWANDHLVPGGLVIAGGMIKHLPDRCADVFARLMGSNEAQPARRKARVIFARRGAAGLADWNRQIAGYAMADTAGEIEALPAVFSRDQLDRGTRVFLPHVREALAALPAGARVLDLGCGNGVLGVTALLDREDCVVTFADVSSQAVASARYNCEVRGVVDRARFHHGDGVPRGERFDLILCNPPFHEGGTVGDHIALRMFRQSAAALAPGGQLLVVGNRHLGYHVKLKRWFGVVAQQGGDPKFVIFACRVSR
ncbi:class I SAM-dependent methyltransferase [Marinobacter halodurans]|uniref:Class I SAM-dependent methyltransferase n=2 Tax=Marinobacter halodurans TaxID=2528979 RepID=A0ABY1ZUS5_9GAMM|nr:class I SAM-dependent methyltransferase [Marinobacter halodurans]